MISKFGVLSIIFGFLECIIATVMNVIAMSLIDKFVHKSLCIRVALYIIAIIIITISIYVLPRILFGRDWLWVILFRNIQNYW